MSFPKDWLRPIRGAGGIPIPESTWTEKLNPWGVLHSRYAAAVASNRWNEATERDWLFVEFRKLIPAECGCQTNAVAELGKIDLTTAATAERTAFELHNFISSNRVSPPKPEFSWDDYLKVYPR